MLRRTGFVSLGLACVLAGSVAFSSLVQAQDLLPEDNGLATYHTAPRYRESESHPLRLLGYILHPVGWVLREAIFRPLSYFAGSTETRKSVMGFREPYDFRQPECFSADDATPDCRSLMPFNYGREDNTGSVVQESAPARQVFFPNVNFDFDKRSLNQLGLQQSKQVADLIKTSPGEVRIVLQGHTDYRGSNEYNMKLGMDRAEAVKTELVRLGVSGERLSTISFGESKPLDPAETDAARAMNRRVETHLGE